MRKPVVAVLAATIVTVPLLFGLGTLTAQAAGAFCNVQTTDPSQPPPGPGGPGPQPPVEGAGGVQLDREQTANARTIVGVVKNRHLPERAAAIALMTAMQESSLRNLNGGDLDSLGLFQQRPSQGWGDKPAGPGDNRTPAQRIMDPIYATNRFLDGLIEVPGWETLPMWQAAQTVQLSADGTWYIKWEKFGTALAAALYNGSADGVTCTDETPPILNGPAVAGAIGRARTQLGVPYSWGGGGPEGPSEGFAEGAGIVGFDCSSLMQYAWWPWAHLPRTSDEQYNAGVHLPRSAVQPGDLMFWASNPSNPDTIHHVAMYIGDGQIIEAPRTGLNVRIRPLGHESELLSTVTRLQPRQ